MEAVGAEEEWADRAMAPVEQDQDSAWAQGEPEAVAQAGAGQVAAAQARPEQVRAAVRVYGSPAAEAAPEAVVWGPAD